MKTQPPRETPSTPTHARTLLHRLSFSLRTGLMTFLVVALMGQMTHHGATVLDPNLSVQPAVEGLVTPTTMAFLGPDEFFVVEKNTGQVKWVQDGAVQATVLDLAVNTASERGLLGIALHPDFPSNPGVYLYWTCTAPPPPEEDPFFPTQIECPDMPALGEDSDDVLAVPLLGNRVDRFVWDGAALNFDQNLIKLRVFQNDGAPVPEDQGDEGQRAAGNHDGGVIRFGPDGKLYIIIGDTGRRGALQNLPFGPVPGDVMEEVPDDQFNGPAPDNTHLTGVILRLNADGTAPDDNPFFDVGTAMGGETGANLQKIFAYGVRNSFGMAFDPISGDLWDSENGDDTFDEINRVEPGFNSGWVQIIGPVERVPEYKAIETTFGSQSLQQLRWPPTLLADTAEEAFSRLFMMPGSHYSDPEFSWKFAVAPAAIGFMDGNALGPQYRGDMFVGSSRERLMGGAVFHFNITGNRQKIGVDDPRLEDRVADNLDKFDITESESILFGTDFGIVTDVHTGPNGNLFMVSLSHGTVYEISRVQAGKSQKFHAHLSGDEEVPPVATQAQGQAILSLDSDGLHFKLIVANIQNVTASHLHLAPKGANGSVVVPLFSGPLSGRVQGVLAEGTITGADLTGPLAGQPLSALVDKINAGNIYVNVHTTQHPPGEIRGQLE